MYKLLEQINDQLKESIDKRQPVLKAVLISGSSVKVLDVQHIQTNNVPQNALKIIIQVLSQIKERLDFNFETKEDGMFNLLVIKGTSSDQSKSIQFEISQLTSNDVKDLKKALLIKYMRSKQL